jgi:beta-N-acetylhexosaminidase
MKYLKVIFTSILLLAIVSFFIVYKFKKVKHYALTIVSSRKTELNNTVKKLSSLFFFNIHGKKAGKIARRFLIKYSPGGIIIMSNNVSSKKGLKKLISSVKSLYTENGQAPPLIGIDQEGGRVRRIRWDEFNQPSAEESARKGRKYVKEQAAAVSKALKEMGFSVNFAPVCDVLTNPANKVIADRSYGSNETYVSEMIK